MIFQLIFIISSWYCTIDSSVLFCASVLSHIAEPGMIVTLCILINMVLYGKCWVLFSIVMCSTKMIHYLNILIYRDSLYCSNENAMPIEYFSPSQTTFIQIQAHWMYLLYGQDLPVSKLAYATLQQQHHLASWWSSNYQSMCLVSWCMALHAWCIALHKTGTYTVSFFKKLEMGEDHAAPSVLPCILPLQWLSRGGFSNLRETATIFQLTLHAHSDKKNEPSV